VKVVYGWRCLDCAEAGEGEGSDRAAEKHGKASGHSTASWGAPA
jgi:hypothetical protein